MLTYAGWAPLVQAAGYRFAQFDRLNRWCVAEEHPERMAPFAYPVDDHVHWAVRQTIDKLENDVRRLATVDRDFVATCYEVLPGRELEDEQIVADQTAKAIGTARTWVDLLRALLADKRFTAFRAMRLWARTTRGACKP